MDKETMGGQVYSMQVLQTFLYVIFALVEVKKQTPSYRAYNDKFIQRVVTKFSRSFKRFNFQEQPAYVIPAIFESFISIGKLFFREIEKIPGWRILDFWAYLFLKTNHLEYKYRLYFVHSLLNLWNMLFCGIESVKLITV